MVTRLSAVDDSIVDTGPGPEYAGVDKWRSEASIARRLSSHLPIRA
jgi:hypothetical protein